MFPNGSSRQLLFESTSNFLGAGLKSLYFSSVSIIIETVMDNLAVLQFEENYSQFNQTD